MYAVLHRKTRSFQIFKTPWSRLAWVPCSVASSGSHTLVSDWRGFLPVLFPGPVEVGNYFAANGFAEGRGLALLAGCLL